MLRIGLNSATVAPPKVDTEPALGTDFSHRKIVFLRSENVPKRNTFTGFKVPKRNKKTGFASLPRLAKPHMNTNAT